MCGRLLITPSKSGRALLPPSTQFLFKEKRDYSRNNNNQSLAGSTNLTLFSIHNVQPTAKWLFPSHVSPNTAQDYHKTHLRSSNTPNLCCFKQTYSNKYLIIWILATMQLSHTLWMGKERKPTTQDVLVSQYTLKVYKYSLVMWADKKSESKWNRIIPRDAISFSILFGCKEK